MSHGNTPTRRGLFRSAVGIGLGAATSSGWLRALAADAPKKPAKSVIVLWMNGGPSTIDLWDLKPGHKNGGPFKEIATAAAGLCVSEQLQKIAKLGNIIAVVRSMATKEGDHNRASHLLRTGYNPVGAIRFPAVGSLVARELGPDGADLPNFVSISGRGYAGPGGGFLGPAFDPLVVGDPAGADAGPGIPDAARPAGVSDGDHADRLRLLAGMEKRFAAGRVAPVAEGIRAAAGRAVRLMRPEAAAAFRLDDEKPVTRAAYGRDAFGRGCLLARRLVERGVPFVEVTLDGWDTHSNNFELVKGLSGTLDAAFAALLADLKDRGLLDSTLVVCQGEFGRTPKINVNTGRDHWPAAWSVVLAGGGVNGGTVVGRTTADGTAVDGKPTTVPDLIATVAKAVGIDPKKQNMSNVGRPIRVADPAAKPIEELL